MLGLNVDGIGSVPVFTEGLGHLLGDIVKNKRRVNFIVSNCFHKPKNVNLTIALHNISYIPSFLKIWKSHGYYN